MIAVDLRPPDEVRLAAAVRRGRVLSARIAGVAALALALGHGALESAAVSTQRDVVRADAERAALERPVAARRRLRQRQATLRRRLAVIRRLEARDWRPVRLLDALAVAAPARLWLTEVSLADGALRVAGFAADEQAIADFVVRLRDEAMLRAIDLEEAARHAPAPRRAPESAPDRAPVGAASSPRRFVIAGRLGTAR